jgi:MFS family permease
MRRTLEHRNFLLLWLAQLISGVGDVLYTVGVMVTIFEKTGSALLTAGAMVATLLPSFLISPFAGAVVDKYPRQRVLFIMDIVRALLVGALLVWVRTQGFNVVGIYAIMAGLSAATAFYNPARQAIIPQLVPRYQVVAANSLMIATTQVTMAVGFIVGGLLVLVLDFETFVLLNMVSFIAAAIVVAPIRPKTTVSLETTSAPFFKSIATGFQYLRKHELARSLTTMEVLEHVPHGIWTSALLLVFVHEALGSDSVGWGFHNAAYFSGQIIGAIIAGLVAVQLGRHAGRLIIINSFLTAFATILYAFSPSLIFASVLAFLLGPPWAMRDVAQDSLLQTSVDEEMLGRVYAFRNTGLSLAFMLAGLMFAALADVFPVRALYVAGGILYFFTALYALSKRAIRNGRIDTRENMKDVKATPVTQLDVEI